MNGKDLVCAPVGHRTGYEYRASRDLVSGLGNPRNGLPHTAKSDTPRGVGALLDYKPGLILLKIFGGMIGLLGPNLPLFDKFNPSPIHDLKAVAFGTDNNHRRPTGMRFESESNFHHTARLNPRSLILNLW